MTVGVLAVLGGVLIHLACGSMYTWGNLISYVPPHLKYWGGAPPEGGGLPDAQLVVRRLQPEPSTSRIAHLALNSRG